MSSKLSHKAYVIGAGITIMDLDMHGENGGESATTVQRQYGHRELGDDAGFVNRFRPGENDYKHMQFDNNDRYLLAKLMSFAGT
ncbi:MAG: hypothetical protein U5O16_39335 [Rhodococcus sp. (in: high G+C Gram-positive bacteria)]|uniref:hypothetical protein n=1 Tax=Rhodococcus sp. TaxID=1831 RepID=UPI002ADACAFB|nr:hypothetical protein [Rhodococcus sp. (in: high G+C Gram-positive bacteria)]